MGQRVDLVILQLHLRHVLDRPNDLDRLPGLVKDELPMFNDIEFFLCRAFDPVFVAEGSSFC